MAESIHNARITATEMHILALFRQELADESESPENFRLIVDAGHGEMSSKFERFLRHDFRGQNEPTPELVQEVVTMMVKRIMPPKRTLSEYSITIEVSKDRVRAFRSRKGAKTLPRVGG